MMQLAWEAELECEVVEDLVGYCFRRFVPCSIGLSKSGEVIHDH